MGVQTFYLPENLLTRSVNIVGLGKWFSWFKFAGNR